MKVIYTKTFLKDLANVVPLKRRLQIEKFVFEDLPALPSIESSGHIEKMNVYKNYYKVRFGEFRLGLLINTSGLEIKRVLKRKEIYKYFP